MEFFAKLESRVREIDSLLCVGLDPHPADLPAMTGAGCQGLLFEPGGSHP